MAAPKILQKTELSTLCKCQAWIQTYFSPVIRSSPDRCSLTNKELQQMGVGGSPFAQLIFYCWFFCPSHVLLLTSVKRADSYFFWPWRTQHGDEKKKTSWVSSLTKRRTCWEKSFISQILADEPKLSQRKQVRHPINTIVPQSRSSPSSQQQRPKLPSLMRSLSDCILILKKNNKTTEESMWEGVADTQVFDLQKKVS